MITLDRVTKSFGATVAVQDMSLTVATGEVFGLVGPNGAGKTTTIRMLTGIARPDSGRVLVGGHNMASDPVAAKTLLGYVPDKPFLYEKLTALEFLRFIAALYGCDPAAADADAERLLDRFGIADVKDEFIEGFSQGMRQRLLFAAALIHTPPALIIDEPFVGLDPFGVRLIANAIREAAASGSAVFLATHSLHIAEGLCHRTGFIRKGQLIAVRTADEIRAREGGLEALFLELGS